jgi:Flp pilus assembly pilin Flp
MQAATVKTIHRYFRDERGQAATEYILIIGLISLPIYVAFKVAMEMFLHDFIASVIGTFTRG